MEGLHIRARISEDSLPWDLLLLADPSREMVEAYLGNSLVYLAFVEDTVVGVYILTPVSPAVLELKNIAVAKHFQGKGIGKTLVLDAIQKTKAAGGKRLEVGTGNSSLSQLALYQKCGFRITGVEKDYFVKNYDKEIVENGIKCVDMIRLRMDIK